MKIRILIFTLIAVNLNLFALNCELIIQIECEDTVNKFTVYNEDFELLSTSSTNPIKIIIPYKEKSFATIYLIASNNQYYFNSFIINQPYLVCNLKHCDGQSIEFINSKENTIYQGYISGRAKIASILIPLKATLMDTSLNKILKDSIRNEYNLLKKKVNSDIEKYEDDYFSEHNSNLATLFFLRQQLMSHSRNGAIDFSNIVAHLDTNELSKYKIFRETIKPFTDQPYEEGSLLEDDKNIRSIQGEAISISELGHFDQYTFIYFWKRSCPYSSKLKNRIEQFIKDNTVSKEYFVAINYEPNLKDSTKCEIKESFNFDCLFYDPINDPTIINKFWIGRTPFVVVKRGDRIIRINCSLDDFVKMTNF